MSTLRSARTTPQVLYDKLKSSPGTSRTTHTGEATQVRRTQETPESSQTSACVVRHTRRPALEDRALCAGPHATHSTTPSMTLHGSAYHPAVVRFTYSRSPVSTFPAATPSRPSPTDSPACYPPRTPCAPLLLTTTHALSSFSLHYTALPTLRIGDRRLISSPQEHSLSSGSLCPIEHRLHV